MVGFTVCMGSICGVGCGVGVTCSVGSGVAVGVLVGLVVGVGVGVTVVSGGTVGPLGQPYPQSTSAEAQAQKLSSNKTLRSTKAILPSHTNFNS